MIPGSFRVLHRTEVTGLTADVNVHQDEPLTRCVKMKMSYSAEETEAAKDYDLAPFRGDTPRKYFLGQR